MQLLYMHLEVAAQDSLVKISPKASINHGVQAEAHASPHV